MMVPDCRRRRIWSAIVGRKQQTRLRTVVAIEDHSAKDDAQEATGAKEAGSVPVHPPRQDAKTRYVQIELKSALVLPPGRVIGRVLELTPVDVLDMVTGFGSFR